MILVALVLALLQVFFFDQYALWGVTILAIAPFLYLLRKEVSLVTLLLIATLYGFTVSIFVPAEQGIQLMLATFVAAVLAILTLQTVNGSRLRFILKRYSPTVFAAVFCIVYWLTLSIGQWQALAWRASFVFVLLSVALNAVIIYIVSGFHARVSRSEP